MKPSGFASLQPPLQILFDNWYGDFFRFFKKIDFFSHAYVFLLAILINRCTIIRRRSLFHGGTVKSFNLKIRRKNYEESPHRSSRPRCSRRPQCLRIPPHPDRRSEKQVCILQHLLRDLHRKPRLRRWSRCQPEVIRDNSKADPVIIGSAFFLRTGGYAGNHSCFFDSSSAVVCIFSFRLAMAYTETEDYNEHAAVNQFREVFGLNKQGKWHPA